MYALKTKGKWQFFCISKSENELKNNETRAFQSWKGMQEKGAVNTIDDFMSKYERVKVTISKLG